MKNALITGKIHNPEHQAILITLQEELANLGVDSFLLDPKESVEEQEFDIVFVIGGDGNFVGSARKFYSYNVPIIAIKAATLGFLPNLDPDVFSDTLPQIITEEKWTRRMMISGKTSRYNNLIALNEFLFSNSQRGTLCEFTLLIDDQEVMNVRADGLLITTPTGSTAYNLSAGGPISLPGMNFITITPVCSHILGERPLIVSLDHNIKIYNTYREAHIWADGQEQFELPIGDTFHLTNPFYINSLYTDNQEFFERLSIKLGWSFNKFKHL